MGEKPARGEEAVAAYDEEAAADAADALAPNTLSAVDVQAGEGANLSSFSRFLASRWACACISSSLAYASLLANS